MRRAGLTLALAAALAAACPLAGAASGPTVSVVDNAFLRGVQRPVVRVAPGTVVTWRWRSRQSHGVMVRQGPERFSAAIRNHGTFRHRFRRRAPTASSARCTRRACA